MPKEQGKKLSKRMGVRPYREVAPEPDPSRLMKRGKRKSRHPPIAVQRWTPPFHGLNWPAHWCTVAKCWSLTEALWAARKEQRTSPRRFIRIVEA